MRRLSHLFVFQALLIGLLAGCGEGARPNTSSDSLVIPDAIAGYILDLVNDPETDFNLLDLEVGLDSRAASHILAHRAGADGISGTADDDLFGTLAELDAVPWVGVSALDKLAAYVTGNPPLPPEIVEGVEFSGEEAVAVVWGVNHATIAELDGPVGLDIRAAENLIASAPYNTVSEMGPVSFVGAFALYNLKDHAPVWQAAMDGANALAGTFDGVTFDGPTAEIALDIANNATHAELVGAGMYSSGASRMVDTRPHTTLAEIAVVSGIGPATMQALHDFAASGTWGGAGAACGDLSFEPTVMSGGPAEYASDIDSFDPRPEPSHWSLATWSAPLCLDPTTADDAQALRELLIAHAGWGTWVVDLPQMFEYGPVTGGASVFLSELDHSLDYMSDFLVEWQTAGDPNAQLVYDEIVARHADITALVTANPSDTYSLRIDLDASECSQSAALVVDVAAGTVLAIYSGEPCY